MQTLVNSMEPKALISLMRKPTIQGSLSPGAALGHTPMSQPVLGQVPETISYYFMTAAPLSMVNMRPCHIAPAHKIARTSLFRRVRKGNMSTVCYELSLFSMTLKSKSEPYTKISCLDRIVHEAFPDDF